MSHTRWVSTSKQVEVSDDAEPEPNNFMTSDPWEVNMAPKEVSSADKPYKSEKKLRVMDEVSDRQKDWRSDGWVNTCSCWSWFSMSVFKDAGWNMRVCVRELRVRSTPLNTSNRPSSSDWWSYTQDTQTDQLKIFLLYLDWTLLNEWVFWSWQMSLFHICFNRRYIIGCVFVIDTCVSAEFCSSLSCEMLDWISCRQRETAAPLHKHTDGARICSSTQINYIA